MNDREKLRQLFKEAGGNYTYESLYVKERIAEGKILFDDENLIKLQLPPGSVTPLDLIPEIIGEFGSLKELRIYEAKDLPDSIGNLHNLEYLEIGGYKFRDSSYRDMPDVPDLEPFLLM